MTRRHLGPVFSAHRQDGPAHVRKEKTMSTNTNKERPMFRVTFSRITGKDDDGKDVLSRPKEIGAVWARKGNKVGGILSLDLIPTDLINRNGVLFLVPVDRAEDGSSK